MINYKKSNFNNYFSIVIPLFNKVDYIERAIKSILDQTYKNFEIIIVNDGSTDDGEKKVESVEDKRIVLINQLNQGVSFARNNGANMSKYDLLAFLDADDIWHSTFLEELNLLVNKFPNSGIYGVNNFFAYPNGKVIFEKYDYLFGAENSGIIKDYFGLFAKLGKSPFSNSGLCIPKKIFQEVGGYKEGVKLTEDSDLWCRIALKHDIAFLTKPLVTYYLGTKGSTHYLLEPKDFQITITLQNALRYNHVKPDMIKSVKKLIAFQQLNLVKRLILTGHQLFALKKIMNFNIIYFYPLSVLKCLFILIIPPSIVVNQRKKRRF